MRCCGLWSSWRFGCTQILLASKEQLQHCPHRSCACSHCCSLVHHKQEHSFASGCVRLAHCQSICLRIASGLEGGAQRQLGRRRRGEHKSPSSTEIERSTSLPEEVRTTPRPHQFMRLYATFRMKNVMCSPYSECIIFSGAFAARGWEHIRSEHIFICYALATRMIASLSTRNGHIRTVLPHTSCCTIGSHSVHIFAL